MRLFVKQIRPALCKSLRSCLPHAQNGLQDFPLRRNLLLLADIGKGRMPHTHRDWTNKQLGEFRILECVGLQTGHWRWSGVCVAGHIRIFRSQDIPTIGGMCIKCRTIRVRAQAHLRLVWDSMRTRCSNPKCKSYHNYGGRGITTCSSWDSFNTFWKDMSPSYRRGLTLDRVNNDG